MKKIVLICFLLFSASVLAESRDQFLIKITNAMSTDCRLKEQIILFGHVSDHTSIPTVIHPNQTETFMMRSGPRYGSRIYRDKTFLLTYICDNEQEITLYANENTKTLYANENTKTLEAKRFEVKNMWATFKNTISLFKHSEIDWTLTY